MKLLKQRTQNQTKEAGQGFVEYAIILILVGIAVVAIVALLQPAIGDVFSRFVAQAPVAPPSLLNYTPPPTFTSTPTTDPNAPTPPNNTAVPSNTPIPPTATNTSPPPTPTNTSPPPTATNTAPPCPYGPHTASASSTVRVQMEDFRCGGAGVAFSEQGGDGGPGSTAYRSDVGSEGPDLEGTSDVGGGFNLGWTQDNEWIEYEIEAPTTTAYTFVIRRAAPAGTNPQLQIITTQGGLQADTGTLGLGSTGGTQVWQDYTTQVTLFAGTNIVRFNIANGPGNYNYFDIQPFVPTATPTPVTPTATPVPSNTPSPTSPPPPVTLTLYSNAGHDGDVQELDNTNTGNPSRVDNSGVNILVGDNNDSDNEQYIGIVSFDTSAIPTNATITSVQLRLQQRNSLNGNPFGDQGLGILYADIGPLNGFSGNYALQATDFEAPAAANNVIVLSATSGNNQWSEGLLGAGNFNLINRDNFTQFRIHFQFPDDNDQNRDRFSFDSGNNGQPPGPELVITYTVP